MFRFIMDIDNTLEETMRKMEQAFVKPVVGIERNIFEADGSMERFLAEEDQKIDDLNTQLAEFERIAQNEFNEVRIALEGAPITPHQIHELDNLIYVLENKANQTRKALQKSKSSLNQHVKELSLYSKQGASKMNKQNKRLRNWLEADAEACLKYALLYRALRADLSDKTEETKIKSRDDLDKFFDNLG
ncbi:MULTISPECIES: hypothetical protein [unclassified Pseudovibrio]|uniref:hypothetical protein n=1 Tax=unclassified Pseudovibrio TaxID=2627060 RepID=UPI0007AE7A78|nr:MULTISPECIES: hypothetical protein [unclassified Pseudovibrio]KZK85755.1 hypothetical protein PsAD46_03346 [Pseudovibrio sp. Ad46]KZL10696.1 hypothetical protein PsAD26_03061 [Pseudovibrio sp. Ad26]